MMIRTDTSPLPVAVYARFSTDRQDARSIDDQIRRCRAHAQTHGCNVIATYSDAAESGAHMDRAGMQRMLGDTRRRGGAPFRAVLVDDLSRLSRELGNTWRIVFEDLAVVGVSVVDVTTGMSSDAKGARLTFGAMALVNDAFLQLVKSETHRGLEGRALAGFWTGGKVHGYRSVVEPNPTDMEHPRKMLAIDADEATVVRRIFSLYVDGAGFKRIASMLNGEGVPSPCGGTRWGKERRRGWASASIRSILMNERYAGMFVWNRREWIRAPGTGKRRYRERPESEWVVKEMPELAIVTRELWQAARTRREAECARTRGGRPPGTARHPYLLSGILRCGGCGASMTVVGARTKNGKRWARLGCTAHATKGSAVCANKLTVSETRLTRALLGALRSKLIEDGVVREVVERFKVRMAEEQRIAARERTDLRALDQEIAGAEARVRNVTAAVAQAGWSEALAEQLKSEETNLRALRERRASAEGTVERAKIIPHPAAVERKVGRILRNMQADAARGRELLARHVGSIVLTPESKGPRRFYKAAGAFDLSLALGEERGQETKVAGAGFEPATFGL